MTEWNPKKIIDILNQCRQIALKYYDHPDIKFKSDHTVVTNADQEIESFLGTIFNKPEKKSFLIGEETIKSKDDNYIKEAFQNTAWIIDPIDGTSPYSNHLPLWGISIARMEKGIITDGAILLPLLNEVYLTENNNVLWNDNLKTTEPIHYNNLQKFNFPKVKLNSKAPVSVSQLISKKGSFKGSNQLFSISCAVVSTIYVAKGKFLAYLATVSLWDIAAAMAIYARGNFLIQTTSGKPLPLIITNDFFRLDSTDKYRWRIKEHLAFTPDIETFNYMIKNTEFPDS